MSAHFQQVFHYYFSLSLFSVCCLSYTCISLNIDQIPYFLNVINQICSFQWLSHVRLFVTLWTAACQASLIITNSWRLLKLISIESEILANHLILCCPLLHPPSIFPSIRIFSNESVLLIRWPKYWSFSFSISPSNELISLRMDWLDIFEVQGTLKSQHHSSKASVLQCSAFFIAQLSHPYMTTKEAIAIALMDLC